MIYKFLADLVVLLHFLWILFLFLGALWGRRNRLIKIFHLGGLGFAILLQTFDWYCPLTYLEVWLRAKHDPHLSYTGSFIIYYLEKIIYIEISRWIILVVTCILCGLNGWLYLKTERLKNLENLFKR